MICFINRSTVDYDIRLQKYVQACMETNTPYCVIAWDRLCNCSKVFPNEHQYKVYAPYGARWKNFIPLIGWVFYLWFMLIKLSPQYKIIHACNLENCMMSYFMRFFGKKMVLDIYDSQKPQKETKIAKKIEGVILPSDQRLKQIGFEKKDVKNYIEIENVPVLKQSVHNKDYVEFPKTIHLTYVGIFQRCRGLENLIQFALDDERVLLDIAGTGGGLDELVKDAAVKTERIRYYGKVDYTKALSLMSECDFLVALYYLSDKDHKYASPNKYYESLALGKPVITSKGTLVGANVEKYNTGYVINDNLASLQNVFVEIEKEEFKIAYMTKMGNCKSRWSNVYSSYFDIKIKKEYFNFIERAKES